MSLKDYIISKNIKRNRREIEFHNFETAKTVSILYCIRNKKDFDRMKHFANQLTQKNIEINTLAYVLKPDDIGNVYFGQDSHNFFSEKHINKFGKIKEPSIYNFINYNSDILINLCTDNNFYSEYIFALSKAKFKVSGIIDCKYSDLNINYTEQEDPDFLADQIMYYLNVIKQA